MNRSIISKTVAGVGAVALVTVGFISTASAAVGGDGNDEPTVVVETTSTPEPPAALGDGYWITFVSRECVDSSPDNTTYEHVFANTSRNNLMESLKDLGPDSNYIGHDDWIVSPDHENVPPQDACTPYKDQTFQMGKNIYKAGVGVLSVVTLPYDTAVSTVDSTPLYDEFGNPVLDGDSQESIEGAVTVHLTDDQVNQAKGQNSGTGVDNQLWIQGGTVDNPLLPNRSFAALRCANDNVNGDNVEYVNFTGNQRHAFCYYYSVPQASVQGKITVAKKVVNSPTEDPGFEFDGTINFDDDNYVVKPSKPVSLSRAANTPWTIVEKPLPANWSLTGIECRAGDGVASNAVVDPETRTATVTLAANENVTCTFENTFGKTSTPTPTPSCTSNCGGSTPTPTPSTPSTPSTPTPAVTAEAAAAVNVPAQGTVPQAAAVPEAATVPEMGTVPEAVPAGGGSSAPNGIPTWAWLLMALGAVGVVTATAKTVGARR